MTREEILKAIKPYFDVEELVCDHTFAKWGERSWQFLDTMYLWCLLIIRRDIIKKPMYCNSKSAHQKGLRCNMCQLVKEKKSVYLTAHGLGKAGDFTSPYMKASEMRRLIKENKDLLPCQIRIEKDVDWLHFDVRPDDSCQDTKVVEFTA